MKTHVIVGAGLAGASAALRLRADGFDGRIVLIGDEVHPPYSRPPLSKALLRGEIAPERTHLRPQSLYEKRDIELLLGVAAVDLDPKARRLTLADGTALDYDELLLATGGRARELPGATDLPGVFLLRTLDDALALREQLGSGRSLVVAGGGFIGAEVAASARMLGTEVTVLEAASLPLSRMLPPEISRIYAEIHRERGVHLRTDTKIERIECEGSGVRAVGSDGRSYPADALVVAVGLTPNVDLAARAGLQVADGIVVDEFCRTSAPHVWAVGDVAHHPNPILGDRIRIEHWQNAQHQANAAARNMLGMQESFAEVPWVWSDQYDLNLQIAGLPRPSDQVFLRGDVVGRCFSALLLRNGALVSAVGVNRPNDVRDARRLIGDGCRPNPAVLRDDDVSLASLAG